MPRFAIIRASLFARLPIRESSVTDGPVRIIGISLINVTNTRKAELKSFHARARIPRIMRLAAFGGLAMIVLVLGIAFYLGSFRTEFRMKGLPTTLSENVVAVVDGYERKESENSVLRYAIRADKATTFDDNHQELENVFLEVFDKQDGSRSDKLTARKAIYVPGKENSTDFRIFFAGGVNIRTRDALEVRTDQLTYSKATETAEAEEYLEFARQNLTGNAVGAVVNIEKETLELLDQVEIFAGPGGAGDDFSNPDVRSAELRAGGAFVDQKAGTIELKKEVKALIIPDPKSSRVNRPTRVSSAEATAHLEEKQLRKLELRQNASVRQDPGPEGFTNADAGKIVAHLDGDVRRLEMFDTVRIETTANKNAPAKLKGREAVWSKQGDIFELNGGVRIDTQAQGKATVIESSSAVYRQTAREVLLRGNVRISQGTDHLSGDTVHAFLYEDRSLRAADISGNARVRQETTQRRSELAASRINALFAKGGDVTRAVSNGGTEIKVIPLDNRDYASYNLSTRSDAQMTFQADGKPAAASSQGRTTVRLTAADAGPGASDKVLVADKVSTKFRSGTDELESAEAAGNAELTIIPKSPGQGNRRTVVESPKFVCDFFGGNNARSCTGVGKSEARRTAEQGSLADQVLSADGFVAAFDQNTQDVAKLEARGNAKFNEGSRNGLASVIAYTKADETVRLRGGEPVLWDESGRVRAKEIDWDVKNDRSAMRGSVSATYYGQRSARGATPFAKVNSPVFVSSDSASFDHKPETALFKGNARAWQDKNYVRADSLLLEQQAGRLYAEGNVNTLLYDAKRTAGGKRDSVPVYAQAGSMVYLNGDRILRYQKKVDIRQGTDRIVAGEASVFLDEKNELLRTVAEQDVVITQPGRKATGSFASYDAREELIVLRGDPATVRDDERGSSSGKEVRVDLKKNTVVGTGKQGESCTGRMRSVYKLKDGKLN